MTTSDVKPLGQTGTASTPRERVFARMRGFARSTRGGATAIVATAVVVVMIGATTIIVDHNWLVDQRDVLKSASDAASIAATVELERQRNASLSQDQLGALLSGIAHTYAMLNLQHLSGDRLDQAEQSLDVKVTTISARNGVNVAIEADLGGTLLARHLPLTGYYTGPDVIGTFAGAELEINPVEVVLAIDVSASMESKLGGGHTFDRAQSRIGIVKAAAKHLVDILEPSVQNQIAVAVIPWHNSVRLPERSRSRWETKTWARFPSSRHYPAIYMCRPVSTCTLTSQDQNMPASAPERWKTCLDEARVSLAGHASHADVSEWFSPPSELPFAKAIYPGLWTATYDCMGHPRPSDFVLESCYSSPIVTKLTVPQPTCPNNSPRILPLSNDSVEIHKAIDDLNPIGFRTYSALGVLWGQRLLSHSWQDVWGNPVHPLDLELPINKGARKAVVLLTDGKDNRCGADPTCERNRSGISRARACDAVKAEGTEIFVVAAIDGTDEDLAQGLLDCSSQAERPEGNYAFLDHTDKESLQATFAEIASQLSVVRRTH